MPSTLSQHLKCVWVVNDFFQFSRCAVFAYSKDKINKEGNGF